MCECQFLFTDDVGAYRCAIFFLKYSSDWTIYLTAAFHISLKGTFTFT